MTATRASVIDAASECKWVVQLTNICQLKTCCLRKTRVTQRCLGTLSAYVEVLEERNKVSDKLAAAMSSVMLPLLRVGLLRR